MAQRITIIQGHPDPAGDRFCHALADAHAVGAEAAALEVRPIEVAKLGFPLLRTQAEFEKGAPPPQVAAAQEAIRWAEHLVIVYPLWLEMMPASSSRCSARDLPTARTLEDGRRCSEAAPPASSSPWGCRRSSIAGTSGRTD
jgi:flavodoxin-like protein